MKIIALIYIFLLRVINRSKMLILKHTFRKHGKRFIFDPFGTFSYQNIDVGDFVSIGPGATFLATESKIRIGNKVLFGPNVTIIGGNHNTGVIGKFMYDVLNKRPNDDQDIIIDDDIWVGANATILKGVHLRRGCVIAAGAVVTKDIPPYSIVAGIPAKVISYRFGIEDILIHEQALYPIEERYQRADLEKYMNNGAIH